MTVRRAMAERRSARSFCDKEVDRALLTDIIDMARLSPSGANLQPLRYGIITDKELRRKMFPHIRYAGYIKDWDPSFEESPMAFIAVMCDKSVRSPEQSRCDSGIAMMSISLLAHEAGLGSCIIGAIDRPELSRLLELGDELELMYLVGLGYSEGKGTQYDSDENVKYSMNPTGGFDVPKRSLESILLINK